MNQISCRPLILRFLAAVCALVASMTVWLPTQLVEVAHAATYSGSFDFDETDPSKLTGCTADACSGMSITIPSTNGSTAVTSIAASAFENNNLTGVTIPNSIITIGQGAFVQNSISEVVIPNSVTSIGMWAFGANSMDSVRIPNSVLTIGNYAFTNNSLDSVRIPNSVLTIGNDAFANNQLTSVSIPNSVMTIGSGAFANNQLTTLSFGNSLTTIESAVFENNLLTSIVIPNGVTTIGVNAFASNALTSVTIPNSVTTIGNFAFFNNELTSVTIPRSVTSLGISVFGENILTSIEFLGNRPTIPRWGSKIWSLKCIYFVAGKTGWPGNSINSITPTLQDDCDTTDGGGYFSFPYLTPRQIAYNAGLHLVAASKVRVAVLDTSSTICRVVDGQVRGTKSGVCRISVAVTAPDGTVERGLLVVNFRK